MDAARFQVSRAVLVRAITYIPEGTRLIRYCGVGSGYGARSNGLEVVPRCLRTVPRESASVASSVYEGKAGSSDLRYFCCENKALAAVHGSAKRVQ